MARPNTIRTGTYASNMVSPPRLGERLLERGQLAEEDQQQHGEGDPADQAERPPPGEPGLIQDDLAERGTRCRSSGSESVSESVMPLLLPCLLVQVPSGELDEGVFEIRRIELDVTGGHAGRGQGEDHRVDEFSGPGDDDVGALALDPGYLGKLPQQPVIERGRRQEPHALSASGPRGQAGRVSSAATRPLSISATRSHSRSASSMKWVTRTIVTPRSRTPSMSSQASRRACGSSPSSSRQAPRSSAGR